MTKDVRKQTRKTAEKSSSMRSKHYSAFQETMPPKYQFSHLLEALNAEDKNERSNTYLERITSEKKRDEYLAMLRSSHFKGEKAQGERVRTYIRTIKKQLKKAKLIDMENYPILQRFIFYLAYWELTATDKVLLNDMPVGNESGKASAEVSPNRKLVDYLKKGHVNYNFYRIGVLFLSAHQYYEAHQSKWAILWSQLDNDNVGPESCFEKQFQGWLSAFLFGIKDDTDGMISQFYDYPYIRDYRGQSYGLKLRYERLTMEPLEGLVPSMREYAFRSEFEQTLQITPEDAIYWFLEDLRYWLMLVEIFHMGFAFQEKKEHAHEVRTNIKRFEELMRTLQGRLENHAEALKAKFDESILLAFGGILILKQEKNRYRYELETITGLKDEAKQDLERREVCLQPSVALTERLIDSDDINLLDIIVPRKSERKAGDRNKDRIRKKTRETIQVLRMLKERYGVVDDERDSFNVRTMYDELFRYNQFRCKFPNGKKEKSYKNILANVMAHQDDESVEANLIWSDRNTDQIPRDERLLLKEKCLRGKYREHGRICEYIKLAEQKIVILRSAIQILESFEMQ